MYFPIHLLLSGKSMIFAKNKVNRKWSDQWIHFLHFRAEMEAEMDRSASSNSSEPPLFDTIVVLDRQVRKIHFNINRLFYDITRTLKSRKSHTTLLSFQTVGWMIVSWKSGSVLNFTGGLSVPSDDTTDLWGLNRRVLWNTSDQSQVARGEQLRLFS